MLKLIKTKLHNWYRIEYSMPLNLSRYGLPEEMTKISPDRFVVEFEANEAMAYTTANSIAHDNYFEVRFYDEI